MMTFEEIVLNAKFDLCFNFELVSIADSFQDLGERELPSLPMGGDVSFDDLSDLLNFKEILQMRLDELEKPLRKRLMSNLYWKNTKKGCLLPSKCCSEIGSSIFMMS